MTTLDEARIAVRDAARAQGASTLNVVNAVKAALKFGNSDEALATLQRDYLVGYVAGRLNVAFEDATKMLDAKKADRAEPAIRAIDTARVYWHRIRSEAGAERVRAEGAGRKANVPTTPVSEPAKPAHAAVEFTKADDAMAFVKMEAALLTAAEKKNEGKCGIALPTLAEAARRIAEGDLCFVMTASQLADRDAQLRASLKAELVKEIEAEIRAVAKAKREMRKAA